MSTLPPLARRLLASLPYYVDREQCELMARLALWRASTRTRGGRTRVAIHAIIGEVRDQIGRKGTQRQRLIAGTVSLDAPRRDPAELWEDYLPDRSLPTETQVVHVLLLRQLRPRLPRRERVALELLYDESLSYVDAAARLGVTENVVQDYRRTALARLRGWVEG